MDLKSKLRNFREEELLATAESLLASKGCRAFSTDELAASVGLGKGTIYSHYSSRTLLIDAVLSRISQRLIQKLPVDGAAPVAERNRLAQTIFQIVQEIAECPAGSIRYPCCLRTSPCPHEGYRPIEQLLLEQVEGAVQAGIVREGLQARFVVRLFQNLLSAALTADLPQEDANRNLRTAMECFLRVIAVRAAP